MMNLRYCSIIVGLAVAACATSADEIARKGRDVFEMHKNAVVTVQAVIGMSFGGETRDRETWANGAVIDPSGLTVVSLNFLDPLSLFEGMDTQRGEMSSKVVSIKILLPDAQELPALVALRDKDLDLAFLRPTKPPDSPMPHISLDNSAVPELLETVAVITQLGEVARRAHCVLVDRIEAIVERPRSYYIMGSHRSRDVLSSPVFTLDGRFVGFGAMRAIRTAKSRDFGDNVLVVVVPPADLREAIAQLPETPEGDDAPADDNNVVVLENNDDS